VRKSLKTELLMSHLLLVGLMLLVMAVAIAGFFRLGRSVDRILRDNYKSVVAAQDMKEALERIDSSATFYLAGQSARARKQYQQNRPLFEAAYRTEAANITEDGEQEISDDLGHRFTKYCADMERLLDSSPPLSDQAANTRYFETLQPQFTTLKKRAQDALDINQAAILRSDQQAKNEARIAALFSVGITAVALLLGLGLAWQNIGTLMTPLISVTRQAKEIGDGHLNQRIEVRRDDEIGLLAQTFNEMAERLREARRLEQERLQRAERMSDAALEDLYDPVVVTDAAGLVVHLNRAAEGLFGPAIRARGKAVREVVHEDRLSAAIERAVGEEEISAEEGEAALISFPRNPTPDTAPRIYRLRANPMRGDGGSHIGAVAVLEDVTYQQEIDRLKTEFIGVASHELQTPVTSLLLGVQLLQEGAVGPLQEGQREVVDALRQDLLRLERMMRDLLDLTRLEAGATPPRFEVVHPEELLQSAADTVRTQANKKGIQITITVPADLPEIRADRGQIGRVLINLLNNALRHTSNGGTIQLSSKMNQESTLEISVIDTGTGIPTEYLAHIFERFVQVPGATRGGAGLGLSIVKTILSAHGGSIRVESEVGKGSQFTITLPTENSAAKESP
jgi:NtrC-family two-component system sensor histidine kinase KinB